MLLADFANLPCRALQRLKAMAKITMAETTMAKTTMAESSRPKATTTLTATARTRITKTVEFSRRRVITTSMVAIKTVEAETIIPAVDCVSQP